MPYKSQAQQAYFNANRDKLEAQGVNVNEWNAASEGQGQAQCGGICAVVRSRDVTAYGKAKRQCRRHERL